MSVAPVRLELAAFEVPSLQMSSSDELIGDIPTSGREIDELATVGIGAVSPRHANGLAPRDGTGRIAGVAGQRAFACAFGTLRTAFRRIDAVQSEFASVDPAAVAIDPRYAHSLVVGIAASHRRYSPVIVEEREASCSEEKSRDYRRYDQPFERTEGTPPGASRLRRPRAEFNNLPALRHAPPTRT